MSSAFNSQARHGLLRATPEGGRPYIGSAAVARCDAWCAFHAPNSATCVEVNDLVTDGSERFVTNNLCQLADDVCVKQCRARTSQH